MPDLPLKGVRILETSDILALPMAMSMMADMGAEVIHVEYASRPNFYRFLGPYPESNPGANWHDRSAAFNTSNRSKLSLTLNLGHPRGKEVFLELVKRSDVVAENFSGDALHVVSHRSVDHRSPVSHRSVDHRSPVRPPVT